LASAEEIPPGGEGTIEVTFDTKFRRGTQDFKIHVKSNDPDEGKVILKLYANIVAIFDFDPLFINFGKMTRQDLLEKQFKAIGEKLAEAKIFDFRIEDADHSGFYEIRVSESGTGSDRAMAIVVKPTKNIPIGRFRDKLIVRSNIGENPEVEMYIKGEILGPIDVQPRGCVLRQRPDQPTATDSITVKATGDQPFKVLSAQCKDERVKVDVQKPRPDGTVEIILSVPRSFPDDRLRTDLIINTDLEEQPELTVPVNGFFKR